MESRKTFLRLFLIIYLVITFIAFSTASLCDNFGTCSQKCDLVGGRAQCSCINGFHLAGNRSCIENDSTWKFIFATSKELSSISYPHKTHYQLNTSSERPVFVTSDVRNNVLYWTDAQIQRESIYKYTFHGATGGISEIIVDVGISLPEGIAFDWITGNVYFVDSKFSFIAVCAQNPTKCAVIIDENMEKPRDIALHPNQGIMFWSDWGQNTSIRKAGMDGSSPIAIITASLRWPNGITVDEANSRIYWTDARMDKIETSRFDGTDRQTVKSSAHPFEIEIFGDFIFWSDWNTNRITSANKFTGGNETVVYANNSLLLNGLTVMHIAKQPKIRSNPCEDLRCSHICALSEHQAQCLCPAGMTTTRNICVEDERKPKLLLAQTDALLLMRINTIGKDVFEQIPLPSQVSHINALIYNPINDTFIISEGYSRKIIEYSMKFKEFTVLMESGIVNVTAMDLDLVSENLIWLDVGKGTIEVMSLRTRAVIVALRNVENAHDISFKPESFTLYLSKTGNSGTEEIHKIYLGRQSNDTLFYKFTDNIKQVHLTYDWESRQVIVASDNGTFVKIQNGTILPTLFNTKRLANGDYIEDVINIRNQIFWVDQTFQVKVISSETESSIRINFKNTLSNQTSLINRKILASMHDDIDDLDYLRDIHDCSPKNPIRKECSHICLATAVNILGECWCSYGFHLDDNGITCILNEDGTTDKQAVEITTTTNMTTDRNTDQENDIGITTTTSQNVEESTNDKGNETSRVGLLAGYIIMSLILIIIIMGGIIVFLVIYWKKTRSVPLVTKPYFSNN